MDDNPLVVTVGTRVAPEELWIQLARTQLVRSELDSALVQLAHQYWPYPIAFRITEECRRAVNRIEQLSEGLAQAIERYTEAERTEQERWLHWGETLAWITGATLPVSIAAALAAVPLAVAAWGLARWSGVDDKLTQAALKHRAVDPELLPKVAEAFVESADDIVRGALGVMPLPHSQGSPHAHNDAPHSARALMSAVDAVQPTKPPPVTIEALEHGRGWPPENISTLLDRIPHDSGHVRIERYGSLESPKWIVYIAGTVSPSLGADSEPFDMESNLNLVASREADSVEVVTQAMSEAGVSAEDPILLVGHSQGGLVAGALAASGTYRIGQVVTAGAPWGARESRVPTLALEHSNDPVPRLAGPKEPNSHRVIVSTLAPSGGSLLEAHSLKHYSSMAQRVEQSTQPHISAHVNRVRTWAGGPAEVSVWQGTRAAPAEK